MEKNVEYFVNKMDEIHYPNKDEIVREFVDKVKKEFVGTFDQVTAAVDNARKEADIEYRKRLDVRRKHLAETEEEFKQWLFDEYGSHKNKELNEIVYSKAYSDGHSYGYYEIANYFKTLMNFAESVIKAATNDNGKVFY